MSITINELLESRDLTEDEDGLILTRIYIIQGTMDPITAMPYGPQLNDSYTNELYVKVRKFQILPTVVDGGAIKLEVTYRKRSSDSVDNGSNDQEIGSPDSWSINLGSGSEHIEMAQANAYYPPIVPINASRLIGVQGDEINGTDVISPQVNYSESHVFKKFDFTAQKLILSMIGKTNTDKFRGWDPGEVLFLGASAEKKSKLGSWNITYNFSVAKNQDLAINTTQGMQNFTKGGHQYVWFQKKKIINAAKDAVKWDIEQIILSSVYKEDFFSKLGIGNAELS